MWFRYNQSSLIGTEARNIRHNYFNSASKTWLGQKDLYHHIQIPNLQVANILFYSETKKFNQVTTKLYLIKKLYRFFSLTHKLCAGQKSKGTKLIKFKSDYSCDNTYWRLILKALVKNTLRDGKRLFLFKTMTKINALKNYICFFFITHERNHVLI